MNITRTALEGVYEITPPAHGDERGWLTESYRRDALAEAGITADFVQDTHSYSQKKGTLRGLHCQLEPHSQAKLVRVLRGAVLDVVVDARQGSPCYLQWIAVELSAENRKQLFVPKGMLHGILTLSDDVELLYRCDAYYNAAAARSVRWDDPALAVAWGVVTPVLSAADAAAPLYANSDARFSYTLC